MAQRPAAPRRAARYPALIQWWMVPVDTLVAWATWRGGELAVVEQAGVGDVVVVPQVAGGDAVEELPGAGAVPVLVERGGQGVVVQAGADAACELAGWPGCTGPGS
jgi:hypothetical protein